MPLGSELQRWLVAMCDHSASPYLNFYKKCYILLHALGIRNSTAACCVFKSFWKSKSDVLENSVFFQVCLRDLKFNSGLLRLKRDKLTSDLICLQKFNMFSLYDFVM